MATKHMNIKRILHRIADELVATKEIARETALSDAIITFWSKIDVQIMNRNGYKEPLAVKKRLMRRHKATLKYIEKQFCQFLEEYSFSPYIREVGNNYREKIWVCWWQGVDNAPAIVKRCIESIKKNTKNHEVIVITEENYRDFVDFPEWVEKKKKDGVISRTHYSDLLRMEILGTYGGVWLDSTFFCTTPCIDELFDYPVWSIKRPDYLHCSIACGQFANYSLGCRFEKRRVYAIIRDFLLNYWKHNDRIVDYLLTDYLIILAQKYDQDVRESITEIVPNNPQCDELFKILGQPYDSNQWESMKSETGLFKLSWKHEFPLENKGKETYYAKILNGTL